MNERERASAAAEPTPGRGRHGKLARGAGERSDGARRTIPEGDIERRGGRDRGERKGGPPLAKTRGTARHSRPRRHGLAHAASR